MQPNTIPLVLAAAMSGIVAACLCVTVPLIGETRFLREQLTNTHRLWGEAAAAASELRRQQEATQATLSAQQEQLEALRTETDALRASSSTNLPATGGVAQPIRVGVYAGDQYLGLGWVLASPTNATTRGTTAASVAKVVLDRASAGAVRGSPSEGVRAPAVSTFSYAYEYQPAPHWWWPLAWPVPGAGGERHPRRDRSSPAPAVVPSPYPSPSPSPSPGASFVSRSYSLPLGMSKMPPRVSPPGPWVPQNPTLQRVVVTPMPGASRAARPW